MKGGGVRIHKDSFDLGLGEVALPRVGVLFISQFTEGCCSFVVFDDVAWCNDILKSIALCYLSTLLAFASNYEDGVVFLDHLSHWSMAANKLGRSNFNVELARQINASFRFRLASTVGEENVRTAWR